MSQPPRDPYARYRPEGYAQGQMAQDQQPRFMPSEQYTSQLPQGPPGAQYSPPQPPPKKKRHWVRNVFLGFAGLIVLIVIISVAANGGGGSSNGPSVAASPDATAPKASPAAQKPAAPFQAETLLHVSGSGQYTTEKFTVGGSGDYDVYWTYNEGSMGQSVNFDIEADNGGDINFTGPNQLGTGGSGVVHVYNDAGTHYLGVSSEGNWTVVVKTAS